MLKMGDPCGASGTGTAWTPAYNGGHDVRHARTLFDGWAYRLLLSADFRQWWHSTRGGGLLGSESSSRRAAIPLLEQNGIIVEWGIERNACEALNPNFNAQMRLRGALSSDASS